MKKPETLDEYKAKQKELLTLLVKCRDALPVISLTSARLYRISLTLADRIDKALEPWKIE